MKFNRRIVCTATAFLFLGVNVAHAQDFPSRPISIVVPSTPGGGYDLVGRVMADAMGKQLGGKSVVVENKTGSGTFRMNVALSGLPRFACLPEPGEHHQSGIIIAPTLDYMDRAFTDAKAHGWAKAPIIELFVLRRTTLGLLDTFVGKRISERILQGQVKRGDGEKISAAFWYSDLRGFTSLSEKHPPDKLVRQLNQYLERMVEITYGRKGSIDKFIGDAVMAFWGAPVLDQHHAYHACVAAFKGQRRMVALNARLVAEKKTPLTVRIGIHTDAVLVGNIGSLERLSYTVMGDGVNIASRLEGINKNYGTHICVSHSVYKEAGERLWLRPIDKIRVKGRESEFLIYELLGIRDGSNETQATATEQALCELTEQAYAFYAAQRYTEALRCYLKIAEQYGDTLAKVMAEQCQANMTIEG